MNLIPAILDEQKTHLCLSTWYIQWLVLELLFLSLQIAFTNVPDFSAPPIHSALLLTICAPYKLLYYYYDQEFLQTCSESWPESLSIAGYCYDPVQVQHSSKVYHWWKLCCIV